jgi:hypothetical protein
VSLRAPVARPAVVDLRDGVRPPRALPAPELPERTQDPAQRYPTMDGLTAAQKLAAIRGLTPAEGLAAIQGLTPAPGLPVDAVRPPSGPAGNGVLPPERPVPPDLPRDLPPAPAPRSYAPPSWQSAPRIYNPLEDTLPGVGLAAVPADATGGFETPRRFEAPRGLDHRGFEAGRGLEPSGGLDASGGLDGAGGFDAAGGFDPHGVQPPAAPPPPEPRARGHRAEGWGEQADPGARWYGVAPAPAPPLAGTSLPGESAQAPAPSATPTPARGIPSGHGWKILPGEGMDDDEPARPPSRAAADEVAPPGQRPRRRPPVIDLTRTDSGERSPFG